MHGLEASMRLNLLFLYVHVALHSLALLWNLIASIARNDDIDYSGIEYE